MQGAAPVIVILQAQGTSTVLHSVCSQYFISWCALSSVAMRERRCCLWQCSSVMTGRSTWPLAFVTTLSGKQAFITWYDAELTIATARTARQHALQCAYCPLQPTA